MRRFAIALSVMLVLALMVGCGASGGGAYAVFSGDRVEIHRGSDVVSIDGVGLYAHISAGKPMILYMGSDGKVYLWDNGKAQPVGEDLETAYHVKVGPYDVVETHRDIYIFHGKEGLLARLGGVYAADDIAASYAFASDGDYLYVRTASGVVCIDGRGNSRPVPGVDTGSEVPALFEGGGYAGIASDSYIFVVRDCKVVWSAGGPGNIRVMMHAAGAGFPAFVKSVKGDTAVVYYARDESEGFASLWAVVLGSDQVKNVKVGEMPSAAGQKVFMIRAFADDRVAVVSFDVGIDHEDVGCGGEYLGFLSLDGNRHYVDYDSECFDLHGRYLMKQKGYYYIADDGHRIDYAGFGGEDIVPGYVLKDGKIYRLAEKAEVLQQGVKSEDIAVDWKYYYGPRHVLFYVRGDDGLYAYMSDGSVVKFDLKVESVSKEDVFGVANSSFGAIAVHTASGRLIAVLDFDTGGYNLFTTDAKPVEITEPEAVTAVFYKGKTLVLAETGGRVLDGWYPAVQAERGAIVVSCGECTTTAGTYGVAIFK